MSDDRRLPSRRREYFAAMREEPPAPVQIGIYRRSAPASAPVASFELAITQQIGETDGEAVQQVLTADGEKLYAFDRVVRTLTLQAVLFDTARDWEIRGTTVVGRGHRAWKRFYEQARISRIARSDEIVKLAYGGATWYGAFTTQIVSQTAGDPVRLDLAATFLATDGFASATIRRLPALDVYGRLTAEGAAAIGLPAYVDETPTPPAEGSLAGAAWSRRPERIEATPPRVEDFSA